MTRSGGAGDLLWLANADGASPWAQATVLVTGLGVSGFAAADGLLEFGARVIVVEDTVSETTADKAELLRTLGADVRLGPGSSALRPDGIDLVVTTGWSPRHPLLAAAAAAGIGIWSEPELAWRLARPRRSVPWLGITGTNGKTTTTQMLESMLRAAGLRTAAVGNIGRPVMETVLDPEPYDVLAVELSSHQLHWSNSLSMHSAVVLNLEPDHFEWHGGASGYRDAKASIYERVQIAGVYNVADPATERMVEDAGRDRGRPGHRLHSGHPGAVDAGSRRRPAGRPRLHRAASGFGSRARRRRGRDARRPAQRRQRAGRGRAGPGIRGAGHRRPGRSTGGPAGGAQDRDGGRDETASPSSTTPRPPTRTPPTRPCGPSRRWSGSPAGRPRGRRSTTWSSPIGTDCAVRCCSASTGAWWPRH